MVTGYVFSSFMACVNLPSLVFNRGYSDLSSHLFLNREGR